eukprot:10794847-Prorocentrum_lima.AAC.1
MQGAGQWQVQAVGGEADALWDGVERWHASHGMHAWHDADHHAAIRIRCGMHASHDAYHHAVLRIR